MATAPATESSGARARAGGGTVFLYFSELLSRTIVDREGNRIGRLWDLSIRLGEPYPVIQQVYIRPSARSPFLLIASAKQVGSWSSDPISLSAPLSDLRPGRRQDATQILLREALLDKQVVDVSG